MTDHAIDSAESFNKLAQKAGTTVEEFSATAYAARLANVSSEQLVKTYRELGDVLAKAAKGGNEQAALFQTLGISAQDASGNVKNVDKALLEIANRFADTADDQNKVIIATKLFGDKLGQELIPFLNQGATGIAQLRTEAKQLGQVFSGDAAKAAEGYRDNMEKLKLHAEGLFNVFVQELVPSLEKVTGQLTATNKDSRELSGLMLEMAMAGEAVGRMMSAVVVGFGEVGKIVDATAAKYRALGRVALEALAFLTPTTSVSIGKSVGEISAAAGLGDEALKAAAQGGAAKLRDAVKGVGVAFQDDFLTKVQASDKILGELFGVKLFDNIGKNLTNQVASAFGGGQGKMPGFFDPEEEAKKVAKIRQQMEELSQFKAQLLMDGLRGDQLQIAQAEEQHRRALQKISELSLAEIDKRKMVEQAELNLNKRILEIQGAAIEKKLQMDMAAAAREKQIRQMQLQAASQTFGNLAAIAQAFGEKGFAAYKAFAAAQTLIDTYQAAQGAYAALSRIPFVGPALGIAAAAAAIGAGMARVASIKSTHAGQAHDGMTSIQQAGSWYLDGGERVVAPQQNQDLTEFLSSSRQMRVQVYLDSREILDCVEDASYNGTLQIHARAIAV